MALPITTRRGSIAPGGDAVENQKIMLNKSTVSDSSDATALSAALTQALAKRAADPGYVVGEVNPGFSKGEIFTDEQGNEQVIPGTGSTMGVGERAVSIEGQPINQSDPLLDPFGVSVSELPEQDAGILNMIERQKQVKRWAPTGNDYYPIVPDSKSTDHGGFDERLKNASLRLQEGKFWLGTTPSNLRTEATFEMREGGAEIPRKNNIRVGDPTTVSADIQIKAGGLNTGNTKSGGSLVNAVMKAGALEYNKKIDKQVPNVMYTKIALAVTENALADLSYLPTMEGEIEIDEITGKPNPKRLLATEQIKIDKAKELLGKDITMTKNNGALGNMIHKEYQRMVPDNDKTNLTREEAETLGHAFKELYAILNPHMIERIDGGGATHDQTSFELSDQGKLDLIAGQARRDSLFRKQVIKPLSAPAPSGSIDEGDLASLTKVTLGNLGIKESELVKKAMASASSVAHIVDKRRGKIMLATLLGRLQGGETADLSTWQSEIHGLGQSKSDEFQAKEAAELENLQRKGYVYNKNKRIWEHPTNKQGNPDIPESMVYNADRVMNSITMNYAQQVSAITDARNKANYLSYSVLAYNYRILPQQTYFNPVTSKITRFVTRGVKSARINKRGDQIDQNLRQMYAAMLVPDADALLPDARERALAAATNQMKKDGDLLRSLENVRDEDYEVVSDAIASKIPLDNPDFPAEALARIQGSLQLDPTIHADLIAKIKDKGQDGLMYIDGLIDFANYVDAMSNNKPFNTYFNGYIDGKTNGLASNGVQMGHEETALRTGVIRTGVDRLLDEGDIRDQLRDLAVASLDKGWSDINFDPADGSTALSHMNTLASELYSYRDLNKQTTMTYGYGMELFSFWVNFKEVINLKLQEAKSNPGNNALQAFAHSYSYVMNNKNLGFNNSVDELSKALNGKYSESLVEVMSPDAIASRGLVRASAGMFAVLNEIQEIDGPGGIGRLAFGRAVSEGSSTAAFTGYNTYAATKELAAAAGFPIKTFKNKDGSLQRNKDGSIKFEQLLKQPRETPHYKTRMTSATPRATARGNEPGRWAYGGSVPGPIQSLDAVTVVKTYTGKSWNDISNAGKGNPYLFTIYDAFKMDANNYDVVLGEVNKNWMRECMNYSYLQAYKDSTLKLMRDYEKNKAAVLKEKGNDIISDIDGLYMKYMLEDHTGAMTEDGKKKTYSGTQLARRLSKMAPHDEKNFGIEAKKWVDSMRNAMQKVGYNYDPQKLNWKPAEGITYRQYYAFVDEFYRQLDFKNQITRMIKHTGDKKKKLMEKLRAQGYKHRNRDGSHTMIALQYFAH